MTTIATDGKTMAADSLCTGNGIVHGTKVQKLFRLKDGRIVGCAGSLYNVPSFIDWIENGGHRPELEDEWEALVLLPGGDCVTYDKRCRAIPQEVPAVTGSGSSIALGAMLAGASPEKAVSIACARDPYSGGDIRVEAL